MTSFAVEWAIHVFTVCIYYVIHVIHSFLVVPLLLLHDSKFFFQLLLDWTII